MEKLKRYVDEVYILEIGQIGKIQKKKTEAIKCGLENGDLINKMESY